MRRALLVLGMVVALVGFMTVGAQATAELQIISGSQTLTINPAANDTYTMTDGWNVVLTQSVNTSGPLLLDLDDITVNGPSTINSSTQGLEIIISADGYSNPPVQGASFNISGSSMNYITMSSAKAFYGKGIFDETTQIGSTLGPYSGPYNVSTQGGISAASFSLTEDLNFTASSSEASGSFDNGLTRVPEPATLLLLGLGLLGLGIVGLKRRQQV